MLCVTFEPTEVPMFNEIVGEMGTIDDPDTIVAVGVVGVVGVPTFSATFPSLLELTRRIISGVEKSAGPRVSATYAGGFRLSFFGCFFAPVTHFGIYNNFILTSATI